jgi:hypothetical protein
MPYTKILYNVQILSVCALLNIMKMGQQKRTVGKLGNVYCGQNALEAKGLVENTTVLYINNYTFFT